MLNTKFFPGKSDFHRIKRALGHSRS